MPDLDVIYAVNIYKIISHMLHLNGVQLYSQLLVFFLELVRKINRQTDQCFRISVLSKVLN